MTGEFLNDVFGWVDVCFPSFPASERGRISVDLGQARGKYGQPKNYGILYFSVAYAAQIPIR